MSLVHILGLAVWGVVLVALGVTLKAKLPRRRRVRAGQSGEIHDVVHGWDFR